MLNERVLLNAESASGNARRHTLLVLGLALLVRGFVVVFVLRHYAHGWFFARGTEMSLMARSIVEGHGLGSPFGTATGPTAMFAPLYPMIEALIFRIGGDYSTASAVMLMALHTAANLVTIWLMLKVGRRYFGERAAVVSGLIWALSVPLWFLPTILWDTSITICLLTGLIALSLWVQRRPGMGSWMALGAYCGLTAIFNPALMLTLFGVAVVTIFAGWQTDTLRLKNVFVSGCLFVLVFCAWPIRNAMVFHAFVPLRTALGLDLWMGNHDGANGFLDERLFPTFNQRELQAYRQQGEIAYTNGKMKLAPVWVRQHPAVFLGLTVRRFTRFWLGTGTRGGPLIFSLHAVATTVLGVWGLMLVARRRPQLALLLTVPLLLFPLPYYVSHAEFRFRLVIDPVMTLLAGYAVVALIEGSARRSSNSRSSGTRLAGGNHSVG